MPTTKGTARCEFCWKPSAIGGHNDGCPEIIVRGDEKPEWEAGWEHGFNSDHEGFGYIEWWQYKYYSNSYILGYRAGKLEVDRAVESAFNSCYGIELDPEE